MKNYAVIENTPGYLPEDEDPPTFDCYAEAVRYVSEYYRRLCDAVDGDDPGIKLYNVSPIVNGQFSYVRANDVCDLGRIVEIVPVGLEE